MILTFAAISLLLSTLGVYGVLAHSVSQRSAEIGLRLALGGMPRAIVVEVLKRGLLVVGVGASVGLVTALALSRLASGLLYGVQPNSPRVYLSVLAVVAVSTLVSCLVPCRRALRVNVVATLRGGD